MSEIVIIGDSLPFPRNTPEIVELSECYPFLLQNHFGGVYSYSYGASTSSDVLWQAGYFDGLNNNRIVIYHFGIVDCAPRAFRNYELRLFEFFNIRIPDKITKYVRNIRNLKKVSPQLFYDNCVKIKKLNIGKPIVMPIANASIEYQKLLPGIQQSIVLYNNILKEVFEDELCDIQFDTSIDLMSDGHHLTARGHQRVFNKLKEIIYYNNKEV